MQLLGDRRSSADLRGIAAYADGVGPARGLIVPRDAAGNSLPATTFVDDAHAAGLFVHPYTFRAENCFLPLELRSSEDPAEYGDLAAEVRQFLALGIDGLFTDNPDARQGLLERRPLSIPDALDAMGTLQARVRAVDVHRPVVTGRRPASRGADRGSARAHGHPGHADAVHVIHLVSRADTGPLALAIRERTARPGGCGPRSSPAPVEAAERLREALPGRTHETQRRSRR